METSFCPLWQAHKRPRPHLASPPAELGRPSLPFPVPCPLSWRWRCLIIHSETIDPGPDVPTTQWPPVAAAPALLCLPIAPGPGHLLPFVASPGAALPSSVAHSGFFTEPHPHLASPPLPQTLSLFGLGYLCIPWLCVPRLLGKSHQGSRPAVQSRHIEPTQAPRLRPKSPPSAAPSSTYPSAQTETQSPMRLFPLPHPCLRPCCLPGPMHATPWLHSPHCRCLVSLLICVCRAGTWGLQHAGQGLPPELHPSPVPSF